MSATPLDTVAGWLAQTAQRRRGEPALAGIEDAPVLSHGALLDFVTETGRALNAWGIGRGDVVLLALGDGPMALSALLAIASVAIVCPIAAHEQPEEYARVLAETGARAVLMGDRPHAPLTRLAEARGLTLLRATRRPNAAAGVFDLTVLRPCAPRPEAPPTSDDDAIYCMTSGTSAAPKVVAWTQASLWTAVRSFRDWNRFTSSDRSLCMMPIAHLHSLLRTSLPVLAAGGSVIWTPGFDPREALAWVDRFSPTYMSAAPTIYRRMLERATATGWRPRPGMLRLIGIGSDKVEAATVQQIADMFAARVVQFYALSETNPFIAATPAPGDGAAAPLGSVGRINPAWTVVCVDDQGTPLTDGEAGEIAVAGGSVNRVVGRGRTYSQRIDSEGRFRTGDLGHIDSNGFLFVEGRIDDVINCGGQKTHASAVEAAVGSHAKVRKVIAFGLPDAVLGNRIAAAVEVHDGERVTSDELLEHAACGLKSYMVPERIFLTPQIPVNRVGKVSRNDLANYFAEAAPAARQSSGANAPMTLTIADLFRQSLNCETVDPTVGFFDAGGDSLAALDVLLAVEERFGVNVPPATFVRLSTPADLATYVADQLNYDNVPRLVQAQAGSHGTPLIVAHGVDRAAGWATSLARGMGPDAPVMVLHARNPALHERETLSEMTRPYATLVSERVPPPYAFAGHSMGAHVALGVAQHLVERGANVAFVGVLDEEADLHKRLFGIATTPPTERSIRAHYKHALAISPAAPYRGRIVYFRVEEDQAYYRSDPTSGWDEIAIGGVTIIDVEGNHHSAVTGAALQQIGQQVAAGLHATLAQPPVTEEPDEMRRIRYAARLAARHGDLAEELRGYRLAIELDSEQPSWVYANLAEALFSSGDMARGLEALDEALRRDPWPLSLDLRFGWYLREQRLGEYLQRALRRAEGLKSDHPSVFEQRGQLLLMTGNIRAAESVFRQGLEMAPQHFKLRTGLVEALRWQTRYVDAADLLAETVQQNLFVDWLLIYLSRTYLEAGLPAAALEAMSRSRRAAELWEGLVMKGRALLALGRVGEAAAAFLTAADLEPGHAEPAHFAREALEQLGRHDEGLTCARRAACIDTSSKGA